MVWGRFCFLFILALSTSGTKQLELQLGITVRCPARTRRRLVLPGGFVSLRTLISKTKIYISISLSIYIYILLSGSGPETAPNHIFSKEDSRPGPPPKPRGDWGGTNNIETGLEYSWAYATVNATQTRRLLSSCFVPCPKGAPLTMMVPMMP